MDLKNALRIAEESRIDGCNSKHDQALHLLAAEVLHRTSPASAPVGWKPVPIEPTIEMQVAWHKAGEYWLAAYDAMIAAAPTPSTWPDGTPRAFDNYEQDKRFAADSPTPPKGSITSEPTILPDGSCFGTMRLPLPKGHWLYTEREYEAGEIEPRELQAPILTHALRQQVIAAIRYAVRCATNCGKEEDFDPDALVQNAVYALCGPYTPTPPVSEDWEDVEQVRADFNAAIKHAIVLGCEAGDFLRCWNEGDWDACAQFDFTPSEALRNPCQVMQGDKL